MSKRTPAILLPLGFDLQKSYDLQAVMDGSANKEQQQNAIKYIIQNLCNYDGEPTDLDSPHATYYHLGRRSVARALKDIHKMNLAAIKQVQEKKNVSREN